MGTLRRFSLIPAALLWLCLLNIVPPVRAGAHNELAAISGDYIFKHKSRSTHGLVYISIPEVSVDEQKFVFPNHFCFLVLGENEIVERGAKVINASARDWQPSEPRSNNEGRAPLFPVLANLSGNSITVERCRAFPNVLQHHVDTDRQPKGVIFSHLPEIRQFWVARNQIGAVGTSHNANLLDGGICGFDSCTSGPNREGQCNNECKGAKNSDASLEFIEPYRILGGLRHASLLTQVSLIMVLGLIAFCIGPIGFGLILFSVEPNVKRKRIAGMFCLILGTLGVGIIEGLIFLS